MPGPTRSRAVVRFDQRLVLNQYMLSLFGVDKLEDLAYGLDGLTSEPVEDRNVSNILHVLMGRFSSRSHPRSPSGVDLQRYDGNITRHTEAINVRRSHAIRWNYYQYLALLFSEVYLDRYFRDAGDLLSDLNATVDAFNGKTASAGHVDHYQGNDLHKLAFWMATGSGKTLLMHMHILQYLHYHERYAPGDRLNRIILLTPNEGLSGQHLGELRQSGFQAELFDKNYGDLLAGKSVEIIDVHKLGEEMGEKTVAVDSFEGHNLVLVDEGHRGSGGVEWKDKRDRLCAEGFSFEYSATFGQALKAANKPALVQEYAKCILFDYSYGYFHKDGYGKDYQILNLNTEEDDKQYRYLTAALLAFFQQLLVFEDKRESMAPYGIERPLWVFVGGSVTATTSVRDKTDIAEILLFLAHFLQNRTESVETLDRLLSGTTGITYQGRDVFANKFGYLITKGMTGATAFDAICLKVFNAPSGLELRVEELKGASGELALRVGDHPPFGVMNVGDAAGLRTVCEAHSELSVGVDQFGESLFDKLNQTPSHIHLLMGSKKFSEGWNSYRVSSIGLMNIGRTEGAQIIQLFGRGVRLRGLGGGLRRSSVLTDVEHPTDIAILETLNVYGVRADYMERFKEYLQDEGLPHNEGYVEIRLPVATQFPRGRLKLIRLQNGHDFKREAVVLLDGPSEGIIRRPVTLNWSARVQAIESIGESSEASNSQGGELRDHHLAVMDLDRVYFGLVSYKNRRGWGNLMLTKQSVLSLLQSPSWYRLSIHPSELQYGKNGLLRRVRVWEDIATALLKQYCDRFYKEQRNAFEAPFREYHLLDGTESNLIDSYHVRVPEEQAVLITRLRALARELVRAPQSKMVFGAFEVFSFDRHLYHPLVYSLLSETQVIPVALNQGERDLIRDLGHFLENHPDWGQDREVFILRNLSRGKGLGFFEAGNFYPDFILWIIADSRQYVTFIDPKGIARMDLSDPKIEFHRTIKSIEEAMGDSKVSLNSFIISNTRYAVLAGRGTSKEEYRDHHVLFQNDDKDTYIGTMLNKILWNH